MNKLGAGFQFVFVIFESELKKEAKNIKVETNSHKKTSKVQQRVSSRRHTVQVKCFLPSNKFVFFQDVVGEGMYLEDLLSLDQEVANLYLKQTAR